MDDFLSSQNDNEERPPTSLNIDNKNWDEIKKDPIFGEDGWVEVPRNV